MYEKFKTELLKLKSFYGNDMFITGSLALKIFGVIDRDVNDIDICLKNEFKSEKKPYFDLQDNNRGEQEESYTNQCNSIKVSDSLKVDIFSNCDIHTYIKVDLFGDGNIFKVAHPSYSINAKLEYLKYFMFIGTKNNKHNRFKSNKHLKDIIAYNNWLETKIKKHVTL